MTAKGFGEDLWRNAQAVRLDHMGVLRAPVRADGRQGVVIGVDHVDVGVDVGADGTEQPAPKGLGALLRHLAPRR